MKKLSILILLLIAMYKISAQTLCGIILDKITQKPIQFATVYNKNNSFGVHTDTSGLYKLNGHLKDTIIISTIGYEKKIVVVQNSECDSIHLEPMIYDLGEFIVQNYYWLKNKKIIQSDFPKKVKHVNWAIPGVTLIKYFPNPDTSKKWIIGELGINATKITSNYVPRLGRIHLYNSNENFEVGTQLGKTQSEIFPLIINSDNQLIFDLNKFKIQIPENGYFIGIEVVGYTDNSISDKGSLGFVSSLSSSSAKTFVKFYYPEFRTYKLQNDNSSLNLQFFTTIYANDK